MPSQQCCAVPLSCPSAQCGGAPDHSRTSQRFLGSLPEADEDAQAPTQELRALLSSAVGPGFSGVPVFGGGGSRTVETVGLTAGISRKYLRAVAKIASHYFLWACPILRGDQECFRPLRNFILRGEGEWQTIIDVNAPQFLPQPEGSRFSEVGPCATTMQSRTREDVRAQLEA